MRLWRVERLLLKACLDLRAENSWSFTHSAGKQTHVATTSAFRAHLLVLSSLRLIFPNNADIKYSICCHTLGRILSN